jgi:hypothetical protein
MKTLPLATLLLAMAAQAATAADSPLTPDDTKRALDAASGLLKGLSAGTNNPLSKMGGQPAVNHSELKAILPAELSGLRRTNARGQKTEMMGLKVTQAEGEYGAPEGPHLKVKITDLGGMGALAGFAGLGWAATEVDSEGDEGYERTTNYGSNKALEKYRTKTKSGTTSLMVANRFMLEIDGRNVEPAQMKSALEAIDLDVESQHVVHV